KVEEKPPILSTYCSRSGAWRPLLGARPEQNVQAENSAPGRAPARRCRAPGLSGSPPRERAINFRKNQRLLRLNSKCRFEPKYVEQVQVKPLEAL
ncbi:hypothetical protein Dimus_029913, partial [Dionaea muscipula]